jgi:S-adenosylmethionine-dependent methyltransferase
MPDHVSDFYNANVDREWMRLELPLQRIEFESTLRLVDKYFTKTGRVCDIGSGPGRYALALAGRGYSVSLVDIAQGLLDRAKVAFDAASMSADRFVLGDAQHLDTFESEMFDAALLLGPLYHITDSAGRARALFEMRRILKPNGVAIVAYLNSWGLLRTGLDDFPAWYRNVDTVRSLLDAKSYSGAELPGFTEAHWSTPLHALAEVREAGFEVLTYAGAEGFCGGMGPAVAALAAGDRNAYENVVAVAVETAELPQYRDTTDHLLVVVRRAA